MLMAGTSLPLLFTVTGCREYYLDVDLEPLTGYAIDDIKPARYHYLNDVDYYEYAIIKPEHETLEGYGIVLRPINQKYYDTVYKLLMNHIGHSLRGDGKEVVVELAIDRNGSVLHSKVIRCDNENDRDVWNNALFGFDTVPKPSQPILYRWKLRFPLTNE